MDDELAAWQKLERAIDFGDRRPAADPGLLPSFDFAAEEGLASRHARAAPASNAMMVSPAK
jgi:hypothetical protein